jgi:uncharacterized protein
MKRLVLAAILAVIAAPALAASPLPKDQVPPPPGAPAAANSPLPELKGVLSWKTLSRVEEVKIDNRIGPRFSPDIVSLDSKEVRLQGFMVPLGAGKKQTHFLLSANVPSCPFCMPGGPESMVEVQCKEPIAFDMEPIVISGRFSVLKNDPTGLWYRMTDATLVKDKM